MVSLPSDKCTSKSRNKMHFQLQICENLMLGWWPYKPSINFLKFIFSYTHTIKTLIYLNHSSWAEKWIFKFIHLYADPCAAKSTFCLYYCSWYSLFEITIKYNIITLKITLNHFDKGVADKFWLQVQRF